MPSASLKFAEQTEQQSNWCWDATTVSVEHYYDPTSKLTQCQLANQVLGLDICCVAGRWWLQQVNRGGRTEGAAAVGDPSVAEFVDQMHVCYRDDEGLIWDAWYDGPTNSWNLQQINGGGARTDPRRWVTRSSHRPAVALPSASTNTTAGLSCSLTRCMCAIAMTKG